MKIYLTRHGETEWNLENKLQGWADSTLTQKGIEDAQLLGERLKEVDIDVIYTSSSKRAITTSQIIKANKEIEIIVEKDLREINAGNWQGKSLEEIEEESPEQYNKYWYAPNEYIPDNNGESYEELKKRSISVMDKIIEENKYENVLIVSHGVTLKLITTYYQNRGLEDLWEPPLIKGTSLSLIEVEDNNITIPFYGDISHLK